MDLQDAIIYLMIGQLVVLFRCLGRNFTTIINDFDPAKPNKTTEELGKAIDQHNQLLELTERLCNIYAIPVMVNVLAQSGQICFVAFIISVNQDFNLEIHLNIFSSLDSNYGHSRSVVSRTFQRFGAGFYGLLDWRKNQSYSENNLLTFYRDY